mgnify:CR=1 FL=1
MTKDELKDDVRDGFDLLEYPLEYQFKAMCRTRDGVCMQTIVKSLVNQHIPNERIIGTKSNDSRTGKFESVSVSLTLDSREELERVYQELAGSEHVVMTL